VVSLTEKKWGTRIDLTCTYSSDNTYGSWPAYAMFVRSADGTVEQVGTWKAEPGRELHVTMAASAAPEDIETVLVRTADGTPVLRLEQ